MTENETPHESEDEQFLAEIEAADEAATTDEHEPEAVIVEPIAEAVVVVETIADEPPPTDDWMTGDVDAALAAVASLSELMPDREAEAQALADSRHSTVAFVPEMPMPPLGTLKRGQLGSVIPALLLIGFGAWLTLTTTGGTPPEPLLVAGVVTGGVVLMLLAQWLGTGRWSRGVLFFALLIIMVVGVLFFSIQPGGIDMGRGYPLVIVAVGLAMLLSGFLARPVSPRLFAPGTLLVVAGLSGLAITLGFLPGDWIALATPLAPFVFGIALVLFLLPLIFRRSRQ